MPAVDYAPGEISRIGAERYERELRAAVETEENLGKILVLDIESGDSEISVDQRTASALLRERRPEGAFYVVRIGYSAVEKIGGSWRSLRR
jgi:hypothetical protein